MFWLLLGHVLLLLSPLRASAQGQNNPGRIQRLDRALSQAGVVKVQTDVHKDLGGTPKFITTIDFTGFTTLQAALEPLRPATGTSDTTATNGVRVILSANGAAGTPSPTGGTIGGAGAPISALINVTELVIAWAGQGGNGGPGTPGLGFGALGKRNGGAGGLGGTVTISAFSSNSITAVGGDGGDGGAASITFISGIPFFGTNGTGGLGGFSKVSYFACNDLAIVGGDGGAGGNIGIIAQGTGGNGGDAIANGVVGGSDGFVEAGAGNALGGVNGAAVLNAISFFELDVKTPILD